MSQAVVSGCDLICVPNYDISFYVRCGKMQTLEKQARKYIYYDNITMY